MSQQPTIADASQPFLPLWQPGRRMELVSACRDEQGRLHRHWRITDTGDYGGAVVGEVEMIWPARDSLDARRARGFVRPARQDVEIVACLGGITRRGSMRVLRDGTHEAIRWSDEATTRGGSR